MDFKAYIQKLQNSSEKNKKIVLWTIVAVLGIVMGVFWFNGAMERLSHLGEGLSDIKFPEIPSIDLPEPPSEPEIKTTELLFWPDVKSFNSEDKTFYAKDLNTKEIVKISVNDETKIYRQNVTEGGAEQEYHDFQWLYATLQNWEGPTWHFTIKGEKQEDGSVLASEIYYQIQ